MRTIKKFLAVFLVLTLILSLAACSGKSSMSLTMDIETGDKIKVKLDTTDDLSMKWDKNANLMKVKDGDNLVLSMYFAGEDHMSEWIDAAKDSTNVEVNNNGSGNGTKRSIIYVDSVEEGVESANYVVAWIVGSNTGLVAQGTASPAETKEVFESLIFSVESTDQDDEYYFLESVIMENVVEPDDQHIDEDVENNADETEPATESNENVEPDVTEPEVEDDEKEGNESENDVNNDTQTPSNNPMLSSDWKDFQFSIDGNKFSLPISYKELKEKTGYSIKSTDEKSYLEPNYYGICNLRNADGEIVCYIEILNKTDEDIAYADGIVIKVSQTNLQTDRGMPIVEFASNLSVGDVTSKESLIEMFGEPTKTYEYRVEDGDEFEKYETDTYTWSLDELWTTVDFIKVEMNIHTGIIAEIEINHSGN